MNLMNPICRLCNQPYSPALMYICCQTWQYWYHADALELDESKISHLVGFKCSKCRRIKTPKCPYKMEKLDSKARKPDICKMESNYRVSSVRTRGEGQTYSVSPANAKFQNAAADDPLVSVSETEPCSAMPAVDYEWDISTASHSGPQKLLVRRQMKQDRDMYHSDPPDPFQINMAVSHEANVLNNTEKWPVRRHRKGGNNSHGHSTINPMQIEACNPSEVTGMDTGQDSLPQAQWEAINVVDMITLDYDNCLAFDDMEFEPQTYFSFHELLASDDGARTDGIKSSVVPPDDDMLEISYDQEEPLISVGTTAELVPCRFCTKSEPFPDLSCQACGMWLHSHCSPWLDSSCEEGWRCGNCRDRGVI